MDSNGEQPEVSLHRQLLASGDAIYAAYDMAAQEVIDVGRSEGYFDDWDPAHLKWPPSITASGRIDLHGRRQQARLVGAIYAGVPARRAARLTDAHSQLAALVPSFERATRLYLALEGELARRTPGSEADLHPLYQGIYLEALKEGELYVPDAGEAAVERARLTRVPLSHAQAGAEALTAVAVSTDPRLERHYAVEVDGETYAGPLRDLLREVAERTVATMVAGELFATRYNTYTNLAWFGGSVWKVILDGQLVLDRIALRGQSGGAAAGAAHSVAADLGALVRQAMAMLIEFFAAHREDPTRIKPDTYWYGYAYSYLTRDMADTASAIVARANAVVAELARRRTPAVGPDAGDEGLAPLTLPPLLAGRRTGPFVEYPHTGKRAEFSALERSWRLLRWVSPSLAHGRRKRALAQDAALDPTSRRERGWTLNREWAEATLRTFGIEVQVTIDPGFRAVAAALDLGRRPRKVLFLPTHQSILDHAVMYRTLHDPALLGALGWEKPVPCAMFARSGLAMAGVRVGSLSLSMFGVSAREFDRLLETVDGYVIAERGGDARQALARFARILEERPGVLYPALTTAAFDIQSPPLQHSLLAFLPPDVVMIPIALRGSHALWPKCPKGNLDLSPGRVEVVIAPPVLGQTTLLPRRRSLRVQIETAALLQAIHLRHLLNPAPATPVNPVGTAAPAIGAG
jgi:hypothetical protein